MSVRLEEWRIRKNDTEEWMRHRQLPQDLQERVRRFVQYKWLATRGVNEESILLSLPLDLRREIQHHLCLSLVRRVCPFSTLAYFVIIYLSYLVALQCNSFNKTSSGKYKLQYIVNLKLVPKIIITDKFVLDK